MDKYSLSMYLWLKSYDGLWMFMDRLYEVTRFMPMWRQYCREVSDRPSA